MSKNLLLITRCITGSGPNVLRRQSFSRYVLEKRCQMDVLGYKEETSLPVDVNYYKSNIKASLNLVKWFLSLLFDYLYLLKYQGIVSFFRRVGLAAMTMSSAEQLFAKNKYDACLVCVHPWAFYLIIPYLVKYLPTVIDISDPLYKNAINPGSDNIANLRLEQSALKAATHIITMNEPTIRVMTDEMGISPQKITFISPAMIVSSYKRGERTICPIHNPVRIVYTGSLYFGYRDFEELQPAVDELQGRVIIDVFSNSEYKPKDSDYINKYDVVPHEQVLEKYGEYDIILFVDNFYGYQVPSKIFEIIAQNKPILFVYDKRNTYFYDKLKNQEGIFFVENKREEIKTALIHLCDSKVFSVNYSIDLNEYSEQHTNRKLWKCLFNDY